MLDDENKEIIIEEFFWFNLSGKRRYVGEDVEFHALKLTNRAKCEFIKILIKEHEEGKDYYIVSSGTKQKLLLLKHMMYAWLQGATFDKNLEPIK